MSPSTTRPWPTSKSSTTSSLPSGWLPPPRCPLFAAGSSGADDGSRYRAIVHALACRRSIKISAPAPTGRDERESERFIRTSSRRGVWPSTAPRRAHAALAGWLDWYNRQRPHRSLGRKPPLSRLAEMNNLVGTGT